jgi:hypothetical protein
MSRPVPPPSDEDGGYSAFQPDPRSTENEPHRSSMHRSADAARPEVSVDDLWERASPGWYPTGWGSAGEADGEATGGAVGGDAADRGSAAAATESAGAGQVDAAVVGGPPDRGDDAPAPVLAAAGPAEPPRPAVLAAIEELTRRVEELARLRRYDAEIVDRLHAENSRLRQGELTEALGPLLRGLIRLHDQMTSLGADDPQSVAGILRKQLLQLLDVAVDVRPYTAVPGSPFDPARHLGLRGVGTDDPARDRTIARTVRPGFVRGGSTVVRPAETEVYRA